MGVIEFRSREKKDAAASTGAEAFSRVNNGPKPNFEDPHSADFPQEPQYNKTEGLDFLKMDELLALRAMTHRCSLSAAFNGTTITLSQTLKIDHDQNVVRLFSSKPVRVEVAQIDCSEKAGGGMGASYSMAASGEKIQRASFLGLMRVLERHVTTGSPDRPEPEFLR